MDEIKLVKAAQRGNRDAFEQLVELYQTQLFRTAYGILGNREDALDALQDAFWQSLKSIKKLSDPKVFKSWIIDSQYQENFYLQRIDDRFKITMVELDA